LVSRNQYHPIPGFTGNTEPGFGVVQYAQKRLKILLFAADVLCHTRVPLKRFTERFIKCSVTGNPLLSPLDRRMQAIECEPFKQGKVEKPVILEWSGIGSKRKRTCEAEVRPVSAVETETRIGTPEQYQLAPNNGIPPLSKLSRHRGKAEPHADNCHPWPHFLR
jgi:hypothetical protein